MSVKNFKFVSPGIFVNEIDKSHLAKVATKRGPLVIGRARRGPSMKPIKINSFAEFVEVFGAPVPGGQGGDIWRDGNYTSTTYAGYAAQAYLRNNSPITFIRLLGSKHGEVDEDATAATPGWLVPNHVSTSGGGAQALYLFDSGSSDTRVPGTLAAVWYVSDADTRIALSGTLAKNESSITTSSMGVLVKSQEASREFKAQIYSGDTVVETIAFNFDRSSDKFIRKVFNTNPTLANEDLMAPGQVKKYWLGESFEGVLDDGSGGPLTKANSAKGKTHGATVVLENQATTAVRGGLYKKDKSPSKTGWFISQDLGNAADYNPASAQKLFRLTSLNSGEWGSKNLKVSIQNIKESNNEIDPFGTFTVAIRYARDTDASPNVLERFEGCNLNPNSPSYISRKVGDKYQSWDEKERRLREYGTYQNNSKFLRVEIDATVEAGADARLLPAGFFGPTRFIKFGVSGSAPTVFGAGTAEVDAMAIGGTNIKGTGESELIYGHADAGSWLGDVTFPKINLRASSVDSTLSSPTKAYFGIDPRRTANGRLFDEGYLDLVTSHPQTVDNHDADDTTTEVSFYFTMDDLSASSDFGAKSTTLTAVYSSGSRAAALSVTAAGLDSDSITKTPDYASLLEMGYDKFTAPLFGGFDGLNLRDREPLRNSAISIGATDKNNHVYNTYKRAIDMLTDTENLDVNLATAPGLTNETLTGRLIDNCETRGDALAIVDLDNDYTSKYEVITSTTETDRVKTVDDAVTSLKARNINSSYGCAYYPWVLLKDTATTGQTIWVPPSVVALGVLGNSETRGELWFAPAGFNRGGLTEGHAGVTVVGVRQKLSAKEREKLYGQNINPISSFPAEGIVVFGQKTLQLTASALDRINVRRLMIFLKKEISFAASRILFDQNVNATWNRFTSTVNPFLADVQSRFGVTDYKLVLDETTTTPDLIDRNILYAKIFVKPARAIEFIALDFVITATGASFEE